MYRYVVLGAGMQGTAAAYDLARFGKPSQVVLADADPARAMEGAQRVNRLVGAEICTGQSLDVRNESLLDATLKGAHAALSAVPYYLNVALASHCIRNGVSFCDLGGNTGVVQEELKLHEEALRAQVSVIPDCGLMPGMGNTMAALAIATMDPCEEVQIRCGGLPVTPRPPLGYKKVFSLEGLTNEYFGKAHIVRDGKVHLIDTFSELEELDFPPPVGRCEAFTTSGGASTCPFTFEGKVREYNYKTVRYPGHYRQFKTLLELGLLDLSPVSVEGAQVVPRKLVHALLDPLIDFPDDRDLIVLRVAAKGSFEGKPLELAFDLMDFQDDVTGFTAMERTTAFPAAIVAIMMARGETPRGAVPLELAVAPTLFLPELTLRGFDLKITVKGSWSPALLELFTARASVPA